MRRGGFAHIQTSMPFPIIVQKKSDGTTTVDCAGHGRYHVDELTEFRAKLVNGFWEITLIDGHGEEGTRGAVPHD
jgi:hypothetical protein